MKRLRTWYCGLILLVLLLLCVPDARAQFIGYVSPQTNTKTFPLTSCSSTPTTFDVQNIGQTVHFLSYFLIGSPTSAQVYFQAKDPTSLAVYQISDVGADPINGGILTANGSYAKVQIVVSCTGSGSIQVVYYGTSSNSVPTTGLQDQASYRKILGFNQSTAGNQIFSILTPNGNTCGTLQFTYATAVAGSTISVTFPPEGPLSPAGTSFTALTATALPNSTTTQYIDIPCFATSKIFINFTTGGAGGLYDLSYVFLKPGVVSANGAGTNVNVAQWGGTATTLGQKTMAASVPVAIASDQTAIPVTISGSGTSGAIQPATTFNSETTGVASVVTVSIAASGSTRVYLYGVTVRCSAGSASLTVKDGVGGTTIWSSDAAFAGTSINSVAWTSAPLASTAGNGMDIVLGSCGAGNTGTIDVQASRL